jgi:hypothetical protein
MRLLAEEFEPECVSSTRLANPLARSDFWLGRISIFASKEIQMAGVHVTVQGVVFHNPAQVPLFDGEYGSFARLFHIGDNLNG